MDSVFTSLHREPFLLDIVDETWAADCLSDDDIDVPNMGGQLEDNDEINGADPRAVIFDLFHTDCMFAEQEQDDKKWTEMGLPEFQPLS
jgi:hypothetical protein